MNRHLTNISAVFLKDLRQFWPMAALAATMILVQTLFDFREAPFFVRNLLLPLAPPLISAFFLVALIQQDAPASLRHEWLTRPVGGVDVIVAKFLLLAAAVLLPAILGPTISAARDGTAVSEALLLAIAGTQFHWVIGFELLILAAVTATLIETAGVLIGLFLLFLFVSSLRFFDNAFVLGAGWVVSGALIFVALVGGIVVLRLQYADRRTNTARGAFGAAIGLIALLFVLLRSYDVRLAVQRAVTGHHLAADGFDVALVPDCFGAQYVDQAAVVSDDGPPTDAPRREVTFSTVTRAQGLPEGWRMMIGEAEGTVIDSRGAALYGVRTFRRPPGSPPIPPDGEFDALRTWRHSWAIPMARFDDISRQAAGLRLDYEVSLLEPVHTAEIAADGQRHSLPGLGTCVATARSATDIQVSCFKVGLQPDWLNARLTGEKDRGIPSNNLSFAPALLQLSPGTRHEMRLRLPAPAAQPRVTITAYEARAIVTRSASAPEMLGGASCRPPEQP